MNPNKNIFWQKSKVEKKDRQSLNKHPSLILWFTGLSGAGKTTLAVEVERRLHEEGFHTFLLDGDNLRHGLNKDLGFSDEDRVENIRRAGEVAKLMIDAGLVVLTSFISPFQSDRDLVRSLVTPNEFIEIYVKCPLSVCETRDPKGLYQKVRRGEIHNFTGIDSQYEEPKNPEIVIDTSQIQFDESVEKILQYIKMSGFLKIAN